MATFSKLPLSASTNGKQIKVVSTSAGSGTLIHTAVAGTANWDEVWIYANNTSGSDVLLTLEWGGTTDPDDRTSVTVEGVSGKLLVIPGLLLQNGLDIDAYAATTNVIQISGYVNRITA
jgi:hypothetical protein|tara:strand:+ start:19 stop:375 length:357 start_codon:yes stop_codon:yes gene_type:complete